MRSNNWPQRLLLIITVAGLIAGVAYQSQAVSVHTGPSTNRSGSQVKMAFFYDPECPCSWKVRDEIVPALERNHSYLEVEYIVIDDEVSEARAADFADAYKVPMAKRYDYPFLYVGDHVFSYEEINYTSVSIVIEKYGSVDVPLWPEWNVTWTTEIAFFYNSSSPFRTSSGQTARSEILSLDTAHVRMALYDLNRSIYNRSLLEQFLIEYNGSNIRAEVVVFIGNETTILTDHEISPTKLNETLALYGGRNTPIRKVTVPDEEVTDEGKTICVVVFYSHCRECYKALEFLKEMKSRYPTLRIKEYLTPEHQAKKSTYLRHYNVSGDKKGSPLAVFIGDDSTGRCFTGLNDLENDFEDEIKRYPYGSPCPEIETDLEDIKADYESLVGTTSMGIFIIIGAGLIDGINPCAFVTLIFFISYLVIRKKDRKQVLMVGISFTVAVFVTYLLMGIGIFWFLYHMEGFFFVSMLLYPVTGVIALFFGILSILDYIKVRKGKEKEISLQLPTSIKNLSRRTIRTHMRSKHMVALSALTGLVVSLLEFVCTGQVYAPTIIGIMGVPGYRAEAILYLLLYNLMFIWPLIVVFLAVYRGMTSKKLVSIFQKRLGLIKLMMAGLFFALAVFMYLLTDL